MPSGMIGLNRMGTVIPLDYNQTVAEADGGGDLGNGGLQKGVAADTLEMETDREPHEKDTLKTTVERLRFRSDSKGGKDR